MVITMALEKTTINYAKYSSKEGGIFTIYLPLKSVPAKSIEVTIKS